MPEVNCRNRTKTENRPLSFVSFVMRGSTLALLVLISLLSLVLIIFSVFGIYVLSVEHTPLEVLILSGALLVIIFVFGMIAFCEGLFAFFSKVIIDEDMITWVRPFRKKQAFPLEQLSFWGCVSYAPRSTMIYFCAENETKLIAYLQTHQKECQQIFGADRSNEMKNNNIGRLQLAVGTYIRRHLSGNKNLFILRYGNIQRMKTLANVIGRDAMITGPWLIKTASDWEQVNRTGDGLREP